MPSQYVRWFNNFFSTNGVRADIMLYGYDHPNALSQPIQQQSWLQFLKSKLEVAIISGDLQSFRTLTSIPNVLSAEHRNHRGHNYFAISCLGIGAAYQSDHLPESIMIDEHIYSTLGQKAWETNRENPLAFLFVHLPFHESRISSNVGEKQWRIGRFLQEVGARAERRRQPIDYQQVLRDAESIERSVNSSFVSTVSAHPLSLSNKLAGYHILLEQVPDLHQAYHRLCGNSASRSSSRSPSYDNSPSEEFYGYNQRRGASPPYRY